MHRLVSLVGVAAMCLTACVQVSHPPAAWGDFTRYADSNDCTKFRATYENRGQNSNGVTVYLAPWLHPKVGLSTPQMIEDGLTHAQTVEISFDGSVLNIAANGTDAVRSWSFDKSKIECQKGVLRISHFGDKSGDNVAAFGSQKFDLYRTQDGLIVNGHGGEVGVALVIPMADYGSGWARFQLAKLPPVNHVP